MAKTNGFKVSGSVIGAKRLVKTMEKFSKLAVQSQQEAMIDATLLIHAAAINLVKQNSGGTPQTRYGPKRTVMVSKPGEAPNSDTGRLMQSIRTEFINGGLTGRVGSNLRYAAWLEFGTETTAARPWLSTATEQSYPEVRRIFQNAVKEAVSDVDGE